MEDALVLARTSRSVVVIHRRDKFRASKVLFFSSSECDGLHLFCKGRSPVLNSATRS
jgi:thioredoxin reductase